MNEKQLTLGSLFDGIGGFPLAAVLSSVTPLWAAEIEPFCIAVTKERFPDMQHLGSITDINGANIPPVDIITFGSPCQDLSVAGQRAGLDGERSGLFKEAIRIIYEMRNATNGKYPTYIVWENVPGAFSSNKGYDFKIVLEEITKTDIPMPTSGKWSNAGMVRSSGITAAWRLLDAQYWGVPQRRKRIYLIGSFGSDNAVEILFKRDSVRRYLAPLGAEGKEASARPRNSLETTSSIFDARGNGAGNIAPTITGDHCSRINDYAPIVLATQQGGAEIGIDLCPTITAAAGMSGNNQPVACIHSAGFLDRAPAEAYSIGYEKEKAPTLRAGMIPSVIYEAYQHHGYRKSDVTGTLTATQNNHVRGDTPIIAQHILIFDDYTSGDEGVWTQVCKHCARKYNIDEKYLDECGSGICGVQGCNNEADFYLDFPKTIYSAGFNGQNSVTAAGVDYMEEKTPTIIKNKQTDVFCLQGNMIGREDKNGPQGSGINKNVSFTVNTADRHAVVYALDRASFNQGINAQYDFEISDNGINSTIVAKGPSAVAYKMLCCLKWVIRRLTPLECERLQGYPDFWTCLQPKAALNSEEFDFWRDVMVTDKKIKGKRCNEYPTPTQLTKWYNKLECDGSRYKALGNSLAIPCALRVIGYIAEFERTKERNFENE